MNIETQREQFRPDKISILLVGESPPASGKFFYDKSNMTTFTSRAFERAFNIQFDSTTEFLAYFKSKGCFLDDLSHDPVDNLDSKQRELVLEQSVESLARRLSGAHPEVVVVVLKKISALVREAVARAALRVFFYELPFPGSGHQNKYMDELERILRTHLGNVT